MKYTLVANGDQSALTVFVNGELHATTSDNPRWDEIVERVLQDDDSVVDLFSSAKAAAKKFEEVSERVKIAGSTVLFDGDVVDSSLTRQIVRFLDDGVEDFLPLVNFFERVVDNPEQHSREQLYDWVTKYDVTINPDGNLVLYKGVRGSDKNGDDVPDGAIVYQSDHQGTALVNGKVYENTNIPQWVGAVVEMPRSQVHHDPNEGCSTGLHASSSLSVAKSYAGDGTVLEVIVNPRDIVSVPHDGVDKIRCSRYKVVAVDSTGYQEPVVYKYEDEDDDEYDDYYGYDEDDDYEF